MLKTRLNISIDKDLADFIKIYATENRTDIATIVTQYILSIKRRAEGEKTDEILSNPIFNESMIEAQAKLQNGKSTWHSYIITGTVINTGNKKGLTQKRVNPCH